MSSKCSIFVVQYQKNEKRNIKNRFRVIWNYDRNVAYIGIYRHSLYFWACMYIYRS